jgi:hypothetical protein
MSTRDNAPIRNIPMAQSRVPGTSDYAQTRSCERRGQLIADRSLLYLVLYAVGSPAAVQRIEFIGRCVTGQACSVVLSRIPLN